MNAVSFDIKEHLELESGLGLIFGNNLFIGRKPASPANCVTLYDIAGAIPDLSTTNQQYNRDALQIVVRNTSYVSAMTLAWQIASFLQGTANETINETYYTLLRIIIPPSVLEWDDNNRVLILLSIEAQRR